MGAEAHNRAMEAHPGDVERLVAIVVPVESHHFDEEPDPHKRDKSFQGLGSYK